MEELLDKLDKLKESLNKEETIIKIRKLNKKIEKDTELISKIKRYKKEPSEELKYQIYSNTLYKKYKKKETDLNLLIMGINNKLKKINNKDNCI